MSDAAYFSAFSKPPLETYARRLKTIDRKRKTCKRTEKKREGGGKQKQENKFYILSKTHLNNF